MGIVKTLLYPVEAHWFGRRSVGLVAPQKPGLRVVTAPEFKNGVAGDWTPEELMLGSLAASFELTMVAIGERLDVPLYALDVTARGTVGHAPEGGYAFTVVELDVDLTTDSGRELDAEEVAHLAKRQSIVARALEVPVHLRRLEARRAVTAQAAA